MSSRFIRILFALIMLSSFTNLNGQTHTCYESLSLKEFLDTKIQNDTNFVKEIYINVKYPPIAREQEVETKIEVLVLCNGAETEVLVLNNQLLFLDLQEQIKVAFTKLEIDRTTAFMTRFFLQFDLDPFTYSSSSEDYKKFHLGLIDNNTFIILAYRVPVIEH